MTDDAEGEHGMRLAGVEEVYVRFVDDSCAVGQPGECVLDDSDVDESSLDSNLSMLPSLAWRCDP